MVPEAASLPAKDLAKHHSPNQQRAAAMGSIDYVICTSSVPSGLSWSVTLPVCL